MQDAERIATLYTIEKDIGGRSAEERREARQEKSLPILADLDPWPREKLARISQKTKLAEAIRYALSRWEGLTRLVHDAASRSTAKSHPMADPVEWMASY